jgi:hypothetical protein
MESIIKLRKSFETKEKSDKTFEYLKKIFGKLYSVKETRHIDPILYRYADFNYKYGKDENSISGMLFLLREEKEIEIRVDAGEITEIQTLRELNKLTEIILKCLEEKE